MILCKSYFYSFFILLLEAEVLSFESKADSLKIAVEATKVNKATNSTIKREAPVARCLQETFVWPTTVSPIVSGAVKSIDDCIQPTISGKICSGKFGLVRENGTKFHGGIDIKSFEKDKTGAPIDTVRAVLPGTVVYANTRPGASNFGNYVVIEHAHFLTLYAHLRSVSVTVGKSVATGDPIGVMGTTSNCTTIPNSRAHVHFEIDFRLGDTTSFNTWYNKQYASPNEHGMYNGFNLVGNDPLELIEKICKGTPLDQLFKDAKEAATVQILEPYVPEFLKRYKQFAGNVDLTKPIEGWKIKFTWYGLPFDWTPIYPSTDNSSGKDISSKSKGASTASVASDHTKKPTAPIPQSAQSVPSPSKPITTKEPKLKLLSYRASLKDSAIKRDVLAEKNVHGQKEITFGDRITRTLQKMGFKL